MKSKTKENDANIINFLKMPLMVALFIFAVILDIDYFYKHIFLPRERIYTKDEFEKMRS